MTPRLRTPLLVLTAGILLRGDRLRRRRRHLLRCHGHSGRDNCRGRGGHDRRRRRRRG